MTDINNNHWSVFIALSRMLSLEQTFRVNMLMRSLFSGFADGCLDAHHFPSVLHNRAGLPALCA